MAAVIVLRDCHEPTPNERLAEWRAKFDRLPPEMQNNRLHRFDFRPEREPADPDEWYRRQA
jgi:hypothetical protein